MQRKKIIRRRKTGPRRVPRPSILIVCEGEKTEPNYFNSFRLTNIYVQRTGRNTVSLVEEAIRIQYDATKHDEVYEQVWVVFDKDDFSKQQFNSAVSKAHSHDICTAYSNESFELWYLLHFQYFDTAINRRQYIQKLNIQLSPNKYKKNMKNIYDLLIDKQRAAIRFARRLHRNNRDLTPVNSKPCTTVYLLVEELNKHINI